LPISRCNLLFFRRTLVISRENLLFYRSKYIRERESGCVTDPKQQTLFDLAAKAIPVEHLVFVFDERLFNSTTARRVVAAWCHTEKTGLDIALCEMAKRGNTKAMSKLKDWGADDFCEALAWAAEVGELAAMKLLYSWPLCGEPLSELVRAAAAGQIDAMELLRSWKGMCFSDLNWALAEATAKGQLATMTYVMTLMQKWTYTPQYRWILRVAKANNQVEAAQTEIKS